MFGQHSSTAIDTPAHDVFLGSSQTWQELATAEAFRQITLAHAQSNFLILPPEAKYQQRTSLKYIFLRAILTVRSRLWEGPETPQAWLAAMARKKASLSRWETAATKGDLLDHPIDLSNLFNPNTFLNAVRQQVSKSCESE